MTQRGHSLRTTACQVNVTDKSVFLTLNEAVPAPADATVIETADELRKLI